MTNSTLAPESIYSPGWCGVHVVQHQKTNPDDPASHYHLDVTIFDNAQKQIGQVLNQDAPSGQGVDVDSALPYVLIVTAQNVDEDAVLFNYAGQAWGSNDQEHDCNFGAYDSGSRYGPPENISNINEAVLTFVDTEMAIADSAARKWDGVPCVAAIFLG